MSSTPLYIMTEKEIEWLLIHYWSATPLPKTIDTSHLTEMEQELICKGVAIVKDSYPTGLGYNNTFYITASELGREHIVAYYLPQLLVWGIYIHEYQKVEKLIQSLPTERLPELIVCEDRDLRARVNTELGKRNGNR